MLARSPCSGLCRGIGSESGAESSVPSLAAGAGGAWGVAAGGGAQRCWQDLAAPGNRRSVVLWLRQDHQVRTSVLPIGPPCAVLSFAAGRPCRPGHRSLAFWQSSLPNKLPDRQPMQPASMSVSQRQSLRVCDAGRASGSPSDVLWHQGSCKTPFCAADTLIRTIPTIDTGSERLQCHRYGKAVSADGSGGDILFVPQRPYMVLGTLREQLLYPTWPANTHSQ